MKKVLMLAAALLLCMSGFAQAVEVYAKPGIHVFVFGIPKNGVCVPGPNGNQVCGKNVVFADEVMSNVGMIEVDLTDAQRRGLSKICVKIHGDPNSQPVCQAPSSKKELKLG
jgi:hypothetical protein